MTIARILIVAAALAVSSSAAFAQDTTPDSSTVASQPVPDSAAPSPGIPSDAAVNPAPGATGPYVGDGRRNFYDVDSRIADVTSKIAALPAGQRHRAMAGLKSIKAEEATQRQRHGDLRDWDRESLNHRLDQLAEQFPALGSRDTATSSR